MKSIILMVVVWVGLPLVAQTSHEDVEDIRSEIQAIREQLKLMKSLEDRLSKLESKLDAMAEAESEPEPKQLEPELLVNKEVTAQLAEQKAEEKKSEIRFGGALRFQYDLSDVDPNQRERGGDLDFDTFRLEADGRRNDLLFSVEWRWYRNASFIHHGWVGYEFNENWLGQFGVHRVPFGILPYASHTYFFSTNYYLGLEDDYDSGLKFLYKKDDWDIQFAYYKNDEWGDTSSFGPDGASDARYSYDITEDGNGNRENNQFNLRVVKNLGAGDSTTELGASLQYGQVYNEALGRDNGSMHAFAAHLNGNYGRWNVMLQAMAYDHSIDETPLYDADGNLIGSRPGPAIVNGGEAINVGAYAFDYNMPAAGETLVYNVAYKQPVNWGPFSSVLFYSDNTFFRKDDDAFDDTHMNIFGMAFDAWPWYIYVDVVSAQNNPFISPYNGGNALTNGFDLGRKTRFNINFGYYW